MRRARAFLPGLVVAQAVSACDQYVEIGRREELVLVDGRPMDGSADAGQRPDVTVTDATASVEAEAPDVGSDVVPLDGGSNTILWSTSVESGDFSDWGRDGATTGGVYQGRVTSTVSQDEAHTGTHSMKITFDTSDGQDHMGEFYRLAESGPAYYSAWFFIDGAHTPKTYWTLLYFFYQTEAGNRATRQGLWDLNLDKTTLYFFDESTKKSVGATPQKPFAISQWVHVEALLAYDNPPNAHITAWLDGELVLDVKDLAPVPNNLYWGIGSDTNGLTPATCNVYVDDAVVSTERVGP